MLPDQDGSVCPKCGEPSVSPPAEVYCVECATEGWEQDADAWRRAMTDTNYVCPVCGRQMLSASEGCSGSFLDTNHPPSVAPVVASAPVRGSRASDESQRGMEADDGNR